MVYGSQFPVAYKNSSSLQIVSDDRKWWCRLAGSPNVRVAVVGSGTAEVFRSIEGDKTSIAIDFVSPKGYLNYSV